MKKVTFEEYKNHYERTGRFLDGQYTRQKPFNEKELKTKYEKYCNKTSKSSIVKVDEEWKKCVEVVRLRDQNQCKLYGKLSYEQRQKVREELFGNMRVLDPAHVFRRSSYPHMKYMTDNVHLLYRLFHSRLDQFLDPISGKPINKEESDNWWKFIIGEDLYSELKEVSKQ